MFSKKLVGLPSVGENSNKKADEVIWGLSEVENLLMYKLLQFKTQKWLLFPLQNVKHKTFKTNIRYIYQILLATKSQPQQCDCQYALEEDGTPTRSTDVCYTKEGP